MLQTQISTQGPLTAFVMSNTPHKIILICRVPQFLTTVMNHGRYCITETLKYFFESRTTKL